MYFNEIKNDFGQGTKRYSDTLVQLMSSNKSILSNELYLKKIFLQKKDAYDFILELQRYGY